MNRPKAIGTRGESAVVRFLRTAGWPSAERRALHGAKDRGDITGCPGVCWSVKAGAYAKVASDLDVETWLDELDVQRQHAGAQVGILVLQRRGIGEANAGRWWAIMPGYRYEELCSLGALPQFGSAAPVRVHLAHACRLLVYDGYGSKEVAA